MHVKPFTKLSRMSLVIGLALSSLGAAHAADIASATASVTNLRYRLIDLDLNDGITPSLSVSGNLSVRGFTTVKNPDGYIEANPLDANTGVTAPWFSSGTINWASSAPGASATLGSTLSTSTVLTGEALVANTNVTTNSFSYASQGRAPDGILRYTTETVTSTVKSITADQVVETTSQRASVESIDEFGNVSITELPTFTLSANTFLILEGTLSLQVSADSRAFASLASSAISPDFLTRGASSGFVRASAGIGIDPVFNQEVLPGGSTLEQDQSMVTVVTQALSFDTGRVTRDWAPYDPDAVPPTQLSGGDAKAFVITFANTSLADQQGNLSLRVSAESSGSADLVDETRTITYGDAVPGTPVVVPPVPGIPEPSTYALMGLGLVGIVVARRRLRPTQEV